MTSTTKGTFTFSIDITDPAASLTKNTETN